jgi:hypothetical protein
MIDGLIDDTMEVKLDRTNPLIVADCGSGPNAAPRVSFHHVSHGDEITPRPAFATSIERLTVTATPSARRAPRRAGS